MRLQLYLLHGWLNLEPLFKVLWWQNHPLLWRKNGLRKFRSGNRGISWRRLGPEFYEDAFPGDRMMMVADGWRAPKGE